MSVVRFTKGEPWTDWAAGQQVQVEEAEKSQQDRGQNVLYLNVFFLNLWRNEHTLVSTH